MHAHKDNNYFIKMLKVMFFSRWAIILSKQKGVWQCFFG